MRRRGFTLMELLVVIMIIALLIAILMPFLGRIRDKANETRCAANLHNIGIALQLYADDNEGKLPYLPHSGNTWQFIGFDPLNDVTATLSNVKGNTRVLFTCLIRTGKCTPDSFVCPALAATNSAVPDASKMNNYDFPAATNVSYSFQNNWGNVPTLTKAQGMPLLADRNPQFIFTTGDPQGHVRQINSFNKSWFTDKAKTVRELCNSPNHVGQGQNVLRVGGDVKFYNTPQCGLSITTSTGVGIVDNIYTRFDMTGASVNGVTPASDGDALFGQGTAADQDAWLVP